MELTRVRTEKELGEALKNDVDTIEIEGDLKNKVIRIKATGKVVFWIVCGAIALGIAGILVAPVTGGASGAAGIIAAPVAVASLGAPVATSATLIAIAAGGVYALNKLRKYKIASEDDNVLVLKK